MTKDDYNWMIVCEWVGQMRAFSAVFSMPFELPIPFERKYLDQLVTFMNEHHNNAIRALNATRTDTKEN
jgi:hypothetical protein